MKFDFFPGGENSLNSIWATDIRDGRSICSVPATNMKALFYYLIYGYTVLLEINKISSFVLSLFLMVQSPEVFIP